MISKELKQKIMKEITTYRPQLKIAKKLVQRHPNYPGVPFIYLPILLCGVADRIRYNVKTDKFDQVEIFVGKKGIGAEWLHPDTAYCEETRVEVIRLN